MDLFIAMVVIPLIALLMYICNSQRLHGLDRADRKAGKFRLGILGYICFGFSLFFLCCAIYTVLDSELFEDVAVSTIMRVVLVIAVGLAGWAAIKTANERTDNLSEVEIEARELHTTTRIQAAMLVLVGMPFLVVGITFAMFLSGVVLVAFTANQVTAYAQRHRLIWTLALGTKHGSPLDEELDLLARTEGTSWKTTIYYMVIVVCLLPFLFVFPWAIVLVAIMMVSVSFASITYRQRRFKKQLAHLSLQLRNGTNLGSVAMLFPGLFSFDVAAGLQTAESAGHLDQAVVALAVRQGSEFQKVKCSSDWTRLFLYVWTVLMLVTLLVIFISYWIIPKFKSIFEGFEVELPSVTKAAIHLSDWSMSYWFLAFPLLAFPIIGCLVVLQYVLNSNHRVPAAIQRLWPRSTAPTALRTVAHVIRHQSPMSRTLSEISRSVGAPGWSDSLRRVEVHVGHGDTVSNALQHEGFITEREAIAIDQAQEAGNLPWTLTTIADTIDRIRFRRVMWFIELVRPVSLIILGVIVAFFSLAFFSPLLKLIGELA